MLKTKQNFYLSVLLVTVVSLLLFALSSQPVQASTDSAEEVPVESDGTGITIYFFWGDGCPHCENEWEFFNSTLLPQYPGITVLDYETWYDRQNEKYLDTFAEAHDYTPRGVPATFIGDYHTEGFSDEIGAQFSEMVALYIEQGSYPDPVHRLDEKDQASIVPEEEPEPEPIVISNTQIKVPLLGVVDLNDYSLLVSTILIAIVDGFNPCSLWVLTMLIALSLHSGSRKRVFVIGAVFLTVSTLIYALFITGLFSVMNIVSYLGWIQVLVSIVALIFALINIKDYFWFKEGVSMTIADEKKPGIFKRMRNVINNENSWWGTIAATVVLAAGVSLIEFSCTAGLPMVWTNLLNAQGVTIVTFLVLLTVYMIIYQFDEMLIFIPAVLTLKSNKFEEKQGRLLKLIGGVVMLTISIVMLVDPAWLQELSNTVLMFLIAVGATGAILLLHRVILPMFGVYIGTELNQKENRVPKRYQR